MNLINIVRECPKIVQPIMNNYADKAIYLPIGMIADINGAILCILRDLCIDEIILDYDNYAAAVMLGAQLGSMVIRLINLTDYQIVHIHSLHNNTAVSLQEYINSYKRKNFVFVGDDNSDEQIVHANNYILSLRPQILKKVESEYVIFDAAWLS